MPYGGSSTGRQEGVGYAARSDRLWTDVTRIDAHVVDDTGAELTVRLTRHDPQPLP